MNNNPLVSIIVPYYNQGIFLKACIDSIAKQTYENIEIIIVNDGSTDSHSLEVLEKIGSKNIQVINQKNKGLPSARNTGIATSKGELIVCLDSDDVLHPKYVSKMVSVIGPEVDIAYSWIKVFGAEDNILKLSAPSISEELDTNHIAVAALIKKSLWTKISGYNETMTDGFEDWDYWIRLLAAGAKVKVIKESLFEYRIRTDSMLQKIEKDTSLKRKLLTTLYANNKQIYKDNVVDVLLLKESSLAEYKKELHKHQLMLNQSNADWNASNKANLQLQQDLDLIKNNYDKLLKDSIDIKFILSRLFYKSLSLAKKILKKLGMAPIGNRLIKLFTGQQKYAKLADLAPWDASLPLVSIVIPHHNYGIFLPEAIDSIRNQTWKDLEIIIVDDLSDDSASIDMITRLEKDDNNITVIKHTENLGVCTSRNDGIKIARGKYIVCLDPDDLIKPTYLEKAIWKLETSPEIGVVYSFLREFGTSFNIWNGGPFTLNAFKEWNQVHTAAVFRKECWEEVGGYKAYMTKGHEDWEFWLSIAEIGWHGFQIKEELFLYRVHSDDSLSKKATRIHDELVSKIKELHPQTFLHSNADSIINKTLSLPTVNIEGIAPDTTYDNNDTEVILLWVPYILGGGAERFWHTYISEFAKKNTRFIVIGDTEAIDVIPKDYADSILGYFSLPKFLSGNFWIPFVTSQIKKHNISKIIISNSKYAYKHISELKDAHTKLKVLDIVYNDSIYGCMDYSLDYKDDINLHLVNNKILQKKKLDAGVNKSKVFYLASPIDLTYFTPDACNTYTKQFMGLADGDFVVSYLGRISEEKNIKVLCEGFIKFIKDSNIKNAKLLIAGSGDLEEELKSIIKSNKVESQIKLLPYTDDPRQIYCMSNLFALISSIEGNPLSVLESLSLNIPVLISKEANTIDIIEHQQNGIILDEVTESSVATAIQRQYIKHQQGIATPDLRTKVLKMDKQKLAESFYKEIKSI